jgi:hypothetical protein
MTTSRCCGPARAPRFQNGGPAAGNLPRIHTDGSALNQIWTNLIDNALDAMDTIPPDASKVLAISTCEESDGILVEITDNGAGIPEQDLDLTSFNALFATTRDRYVSIAGDWPTFAPLLPPPAEGGAPPHLRSRRSEPALIDHKR